MDAQISTFDLLPLVEQDVQLKRSGSWWIGPCPFCGGEDRFNLHSTPDGWKWFCRHCGDGRYQDAAAYIMRRENIDFPAALKKIGGDKPDWKVQNQRTAELRKASEERQPTPTWRARGRGWAEECRQNLWKPVGAKALEYLHSRGLSDFTIVKYGLGYNPGDRTEPLVLWGLEGDGQVKLERGITIPGMGMDGLYYIKIRRAVAPGSKERKYVQVRGGKLGVFGWDNLRGAWLAMVTEGEFDTMILDQQAGDLAGVCTFGAATNSPLTVSSDLLYWTGSAAHLAACYDNDDAGREGSLALQKNLPRLKIMSLPDLFHDINDAHLAGFDLADWLCREVERLGIIANEQSIQDLC